MRWFRPLYDWLPFKRKFVEPAKRPMSRCRWRLSIESLEDRFLLAAFAAADTQLNLNMNVPNKDLKIPSIEKSYYFTLTIDTWHETNSNNVIGTGAATLTVIAAGIKAFTNKINN